MFIFSYIAVVLSIFYFWAAAFIFKNKKNDQLSKYLSLCIFWAGVCMASNGLTDLSLTEIIARFFAGIGLISGNFLIGSFVSFTEIFVTEKKLQIYKKIIIFTPAFILSALSFSHYYITDIKITGTSPVETIPGIVNIFMLIYSFSGSIFSIYRLFSHYKKSSSKKQKQIIYIGIGFFIMLFSGIFFTVFMPLLGEVKYFTLGTLFTVFMLGCTSYAIFKHKLLDIRVVVQKSIIYTILLACITGTYLCLLFILLFFIKEQNNVLFLITAILTTIIGIFTVPTIKAYFSRITDKIFFQDKYDYSTTIHELSEILSKHLELRTIIREITEKLEDALKIKFAYVLLDEKKKIFTNTKAQTDGNEFLNKTIFALSQKENIITIDDIEYGLEKIALPEETKKIYLDFKNLNRDHDIAAVVPLQTDKKTIGAVLIGEKLSGHFFTDEDVLLLKTFAGQATLAIEKAELFEQVKDYSDNLAQKIHDRTAEIKEIQKNQEQMMLDISHKLQTPLTVLKGEVNRMEQQNPKDANLRAFEKSIDHVSKFISDMLKIAKMDFDSNEKNKEKFDLSEMMDELIEYFNIPAEDKGIKILYQIQDNIKYFGVKENIEELITNLVSNAVKYISNKKLITIKLHENDENVYIEVEDTGVGIPEEEIPYLFKRFYRPQKQNDEKTGTGLGLAICEKIVKNHKGKIYIASKVNVGTKVTIILPQKK